MRIKLGPKTFKFISSFEDFTLSTIKTYMTTHDQVDELIKKSHQKLRDLENVTDEMKETHRLIEQERRYILKIPKITKNLVKRKKLERDSVTKKENLESKFDELDSRVLLYDSELTDLQFEITGKRIDLLCALCKSDSFKDFIENTAGVTRGHINISVETLLSKLGAFVDFWESCPNVESFNMKTSDRIVYEKFKVHELDKTTLVRETLASVQAQKALNFKTQLDSGSFDNICKFVAILVRPAKEKEEISHTKKSFISGKRLKGLTHSEKLALYLEELETTWTKRAETFKHLKLSTAIGVLKQYFEKKNL